MLICFGLYANVVLKTLGNSTEFSHCSFYHLMETWNVTGIDGEFDTLSTCFEKVFFQQVQLGINKGQKVYLAETLNKNSVQSSEEFFAYCLQTFDYFLSSLYIYIYIYIYKKKKKKKCPVPIKAIKKRKILVKIYYWQWSIIIKKKSY